MAHDHLSSTERFEESLTNPKQKTIKQQQIRHNNQQQQQLHQDRKPKKVVIDTNVDIQKRNQLYASTESLDSNDTLDGPTPTRTSRDDVLESLGYKSRRLPKPTANNANQNAVPANLCHLCGRRVYPMERIDIGELYHRGCFRCHTCGLQLTLKTFCRVLTSAKDAKEVYCKTHVPKLEAAYDKEALEIQAAIRAQKGASDKILRQYESSPNKYDPDAMEFEHARNIKHRQKVKRRKSLKTTEDYQKFGIFDAQEALEKKHRKEEDELYNEMYEERKSQLKNLEVNLAIEKEKTVKELVAWFENQKVSEDEKKSGIKKVEQYYKEQRELKIKELLEKMHVEEQEAVARLTQKHAQEMLFMIEQKDIEIGETLEKRNSQYARQTSDKNVEHLSEDDDDDKEENTLKKESGKYSDDIKLKPKSEVSDNEGDASYDDNDIEEAIEEKGPRYEIYDLDDYNKSTEHVLSDSKHKTKVPTEIKQDDDYAKKEENRGKKGRDVERTEIIIKDDSNNKTSNKKQIKINQEKMNEQKNKNIISETEEIADKNLNKNNDFSNRNENKGKYLLNIDENNVDKKVTKSPKFIDVSFDKETQKVKTEKEQKTKKDVDVQVISNQKHRDQNTNTQKTDIKNIQVEVEEGDDEDNNNVNIINNKESKKKKDFEEEDDEIEDDDDESETIEDRIKKVLKQSNLKIKPKKDNGNINNNSSKATLTKPLPEKQNIWKDTSKLSGGDRSNLSDSKLNSSNDSLGERRKSNHVRYNIEDTDDDSPRMSMPPNAEPPVCRKSKLYKNPEIFKEFDKHAFEEAKKDPKSFTDLVRRLSYNCKTDLQKVRAIFRWITAKDLNKMEFSQDLTSNTPMGLLRGIKSGTETYHNLFKRLCSYVGIHCEIINGFSKGVGYRPGSRFKNSKFRNQWTAVWIKDSWRFINCNWGARHVKQPGDQQLTYKIDEFYFLTDPEDHIQQHFPDDPKWQLLKRPISLDDFVRMPVVKSPFFNNRLEFAEKTESVLKTSSDGYVELKLSIPHLMSFACKLLSKDHTVPEESLSNRCFIRFIGKCVIFATRIPQPGRYYWDIFVDKNWQSESLDNACSFLVYNFSLSPNAHQIGSYPLVPNFGLTPSSERYGLLLAESFDPYIVCKGSTVIEFDLMHKNNVKISLSLSYFSQTDSKEIECDQYSMVKFRNKETLECLVRCPQKGHYVLTLIGLDKTIDEAIPISLYRCFLDCRIASENTKALPHTTSRWKDCRLIEPLDGELPTNTNITFKLESPVAFEIVASLNNNWYSFQKVDNITSSGNSSLWQGTMNTGPKVTKLVIYGRYNSSNDKFVPFVEYFVKEPSIQEEVHALFKYI